MQVGRLVLIRYKPKIKPWPWFCKTVSMTCVWPICFQGQVNRSKRFRFVSERWAKSVIRRCCAKRLNGIYYKSWLHIRAETDSTGMIDSYQPHPPVCFLNVGYILTRYISVSCCHVLQNRCTLALFDLGWKSQTRSRTGRRLQTMIQSSLNSRDVTEGTAPSTSQAWQKPSALRRARSVSGGRGFHGVKRANVAMICQEKGLGPSQVRQSVSFQHPLVLIAPVMKLHLHEIGSCPSGLWEKCPLCYSAGNTTAK